MSSRLLGRPGVEGRAGAIRAELESAAAALGASAIVGVTLDIEALGQSGNMLMISVTGTAVVVQ